MSLDPQSDDFWERAEHEMRVRQHSTWLSTMLLLRSGMTIILFSASYMFFATLMEPARGYFFSSVERTVHPIFWCLVGLGFIIVGAYLRFQALGPIVERLKDE